MGWRLHRVRAAAVGACLVFGACSSDAPRPAATTTPPASPVPVASPTPSTATSPLPYETPGWFRDGVLYQIFVRSFADSNGDGVGDLGGIARRLDHLEGLGVTAIWLTPIFESPSYHGYDTTDYYTIDPDFGTRDDLTALVQSAHDRGIRVILDYVASHTSDQHPFFEDAYGNPASEYSDWYIWRDGAHTDYQSFFDVETLPSINHASDAANAYFLDMARYWMDLDGDGDYTDGIDGFRCDYALGSPHAFWELLRSSLKPLNPDMLLLGEVWVDDPGQQADYFEDQFDALFDFPLYIALQANPEISGDGMLNDRGFVFTIEDLIEESEEVFPPEGILVRFAGNHDTDRLATEVGESPARQRLAALLIASLDGTPMLYYGEEIGMKGRKGGGPQYDEYRRQPMDWYAGLDGPDQTDWFLSILDTRAHDGISVEEQEDDPESLLNFYRAIYAMRAASPALSSGGYAPLPITPDEDVWGFWRRTDDQIVSAIFNFNDEPGTFSLDLSSAPGQISDAPVTLFSTEASNGGASLTLDPEAIALGPAEALIVDWTP